MHSSVHFSYGSLRMEAFDYSTHVNVSYRWYVAARENMVCLLVGSFGDRFVYLRMWVMFAFGMVLTFLVA